MSPELEAGCGMGVDREDSSMTEHSESLLLSTVTRYKSQKPLLQHKANKKQCFSVYLLFQIMNAF